MDEKIENVENQTFEDFLDHLKKTIKNKKEMYEYYNVSMHLNKENINSLLFKYKDLKILDDLDWNMIQDNIIKYINENVSTVLFIDLKSITNHSRLIYNINRIGKLVTYSCYVNIS